MAAGLGFKTFNTGDVLSAADVNGYLMQGVLVFASTAARDAAITAPSEGQFAFTKDTNSLFYYDGAAWVASGATGDIEGVTAGTGISGGGTSGTVTITNSMATAIDAKGDLIGGTGADTFARLAVGTNGQVLTADSAETTGLKWASAASGGGMTLINTGGTTLSGASVSISTIPSTYKKLEIFIVNPRPATDAVSGTVRFNGSSTSNTYFNAEGDQTDGGPEVFNANAINWSYTTDNGTQAGLVHITIPDYANSTTWKFAEIYSIVQDSTTPTSAVILHAMGVRNNTEAISSLEFLWSSGNGTSGTIYVYGVN